MVESSKTDILAITETFLGLNDDAAVIQEVTPSTHNFIHTPRTDRQGGGVAILTHKCLRVEHIEKSSVSSFEYGFYKIRSRQTNFHILLIYRPPSNSFSVFLDELHELLDDTFSVPNLIVLGDFNVHVDKPDHIQTIKLTELLDVFSLTQHVTFPTHVSGHTLDLVISREGSGLVNTPHCGELLSDHYCIDGKVHLPGREKITKHITYRPLKSVPLETVRSELEAALLSCDQEGDLDGSLDSLYTCFRTVMDNVAPVITKQITIHEKSPWYNRSLAQEKREVRKAERKWRASKSDQSLKEAYTTLLQSHFQSIASARTVYYRNLIENNISDSKKIFNIISSLSKPDSDPVFPQPPASQGLADHFGEYFTEKVEGIRQTFQDFDAPHDNPITVTPPHTQSALAQFEPVDVEFVSGIIKAMPNKTSSLDPIPTNLVKENVDLLSHHFAAIVNKSLNACHVPSLLKNAIVTPIIKKAGLPPELKNYRPISNLPFISKVLEKVVASQLHRYIVDHGLAATHQSAYRKMHSTETALVKIMDDIFRGIDNRRVAYLFLLDLSAAFDTIDHDILLSRLRDDFGITGKALAWFSSYLSNRQQSVLVDEQKSRPFPLKFGVPQGSVLGPILFSLYITPIQDIIRTSGMEVHSYADDTQIYITVPIDEALDADLISNMNSCLNNVSRWMAQNKLKLNASKTEAIALATPHTLKFFEHPDIVIDGCPVTFSTRVKNLGVIIDQTLSLDDHVLQTCRSCYYFLYNLRRIRPCLDTRTCTMAVQALVISRLDNCNAILNGITGKNIKLLQKVQNMAARTVYNLKKSDHISDALRSLH